MTDILDTESDIWTSTIRLPSSLKKALVDRKSDGESINDAIKGAIAAYVGRPELAPRNIEKDVSEQLARDAVRLGTEAIGSLIRIANHCKNRDQLSLACVLWTAAARLTLQQSEEDGGGRLAAAQQLSRSASTAWAGKRYELAVALWRESLDLDPDLLEAANRLGQALYFRARNDKSVTPSDQQILYREAEGLLGRVMYDNRARLFHGWAMYYLAVADKHVDRSERALDEVLEAMKGWAFGQRALDTRSSWLRQVAELGRVDAERAEKLVDFANRNASWPSVSYVEDVVPRLGQPEEAELMKDDTETNE